jgi:putative PIN family toxin of toxin-antitoxin system
MPSVKVSVVFDTNIYVSALLFGGIPEEIFELAREKSIELIVSPAILLELGKILQNKFNFKRREILYALQEIRRIAKVVFPKIKLNIIKNDPPDNHILECALAGQANFIVTGDKKHLRVLNQFRNIKILLPAEFIRII